MKFIAAAIAGVLATTVSSAAVPLTPRLVIDTSAVDTIIDTIQSWENDTATITTFLNNVLLNQFQSVEDLHDAALSAIQALGNEQTNAGTVLSLLGNTVNLVKANNIISTSSAFSDVSSLLTKLSTLDPVADAQSITSLLTQIAQGTGGASGLCNSMLPATNSILFEATTQIVNVASVSTSVSSLVGLSSSKPLICGAIPL